MCFGWECGPEREDLQSKSIDIPDLDDKEAVEKWCDLCLFYAEGPFSSKLVKDEYSIKHSYSNPIWASDWNIKDMYLGSDTGLSRCFGPDRMIREIREDDLERAATRLEFLGEPIRECDKHALAETQDVIAFCQANINAGLIVLINDE